jgi:TPR repeat protein
MISRIFTSRFIVLLISVFVTSSALSYAFLSQSPTDANVRNEIDNDALIDKALGLSVDGYYEEAFTILKPLADKDVTRAKLYLAVAYYHGNGAPRDIPKALMLFLDLQDKNYEPGIVNTYLNLIGSLQLN